MNDIRPCVSGEQTAICNIINAAAERYRGVIPADCWHDPYMSHDALAGEITAGVQFHGVESEGELIGVMGIQKVRDVDLIRHAYVLPAHQGSGIGSRLLTYLRAHSRRPQLIGTWADASWAIGFYQRHGFALVEPDRARVLLRGYWKVSERQIETSVVLASS